MSTHEQGKANSGQEVWRQPRTDGYREAGLASLWACLLAFPFFAVGGGLIYVDWADRQAAIRAEAEAAQAWEHLVAASPEPVVGLETAVRGREVFVTVCAACHGQDGKGIEGLGKNLVESDFVARQTDAQFHAYVIVGRPDAKPMPMPPRAGRPDLTDAQIDDVVTYVRGLQDPRRMPELPAYVVDTTPTADQQAAALEAAGGDAELAAWIASGNKLFHTTCVACHGQGGIGIAGNGKPLIENAFINSLDDEGLLAFIQKGRLPTDPANTTGILMPPKGGNPALSEDDILDIISYLRTLKGNHPVGDGSN
ncbi:MAG: c-type cytochrome [Phycisphaerales bacterium]|nr:c-type cytochrome [Phycisphaerales bacterium]